MKIYFAGAIRGGRDDAKIYENIIEYLNKIGQVLTEHVGNLDFDRKGEKNSKDTTIYKRDIEWLKSADVIVAEVTTPSLGVGYELGIAEKLGKPILCLYNFNEDKRLSAMIKGNKQFICLEYKNLSEVQSAIDGFFLNL